MVKNVAEKILSGRKCVDSKGETGVKATVREEVHPPCQRLSSRKKSREHKTRTIWMQTLTLIKNSRHWTVAHCLGMGRPSKHSTEMRNWFPWLWERHTALLAQPALRTLVRTSSFQVLRHQADCTRLETHFIIKCWTLKENRTL